MIITNCGNSSRLTNRVARRLNVKFSPLIIGSFPDGDIYMRYRDNVKGEVVVIVHSFQPHPDQSLFDCIFAAETAQDLGARKVVLVAPYLAYMRQDKRFHPGEAISSRIMGKHLSQAVDVLITVDPHLHRYKSLSEVFSCHSQCLSANKLIGEYVRRKLKNAVIIGPDAESYQWAEVIAKEAGVECSVLVKTRFSSEHVAVKTVKEVKVEGKNVIIVDDIISTGHTVAEAAKLAYQQGAKSVSAICVHGLFSSEASTILKRAGVSKIISTNTIEHPTNGIDISDLIAESLQGVLTRRTHSKE